MGEMVEFPSNGNTASGYLARPGSANADQPVPPQGRAPGLAPAPWFDNDRGPGVVVIQEWWGLVPHIKDVCDRLAIEGFTALAPDLYHGKTASEPDEAGKALMSLDIEQAARDMAGSVDFLVQDTGARGQRVGVIGFCAGGGLAMFLAASKPEVAACVPFYGVGPAIERADFTKLKANVLGHWGEKDHSYDHAKIEQLEQKLRQAGVGVEMQWYDGDHAFFNDTRPEVYNPEAAQLAWDRTLAFLRQNLSQD